MKNLLFIIFCAFSLFLAIYYYQKYANTQQAIALANRRILDRDTEIFRLQKKLGSTENTNPTTLPETPVSNSTSGKLSVAAINKLKAQGLQNPEEDLKENLLKNQKSFLITKGVLGGKMAIREIQILNEHYALAYFEDGHTGGYLMLRYDLSTGGRINWKVLDTVSLQ